jgi:hypothetical protein
MSAHMLVQIPALVFLGWCLGLRLELMHPHWMKRLHPFRWALLLCAMFALGLWMVPRLLDLAVENFAVDIIKAVTLTFGAGLALRLGWRNTGPVVRGLLHVEAMASLLRLGWVYAESPARLCTTYGLKDQYWLGNVLILAGALYAVTMAWRALNGVATPNHAEQG